MPRPRKETTAEPVKDEGLVTLRHFAEDGRLFIGGEVYSIVDGFLKVKPEHVEAVNEHIRLMGG